MCVYYMNLAQSKLILQKQMHFNIWNANSGSDLDVMRPEKRLQPVNIVGYG